MITHTEEVVLGLSQTGLTLTATLKNADGTAATATLATSAFTEVGNGNYFWSATIADETFGGYAEIKSGATLKAISRPIKMDKNEHIIRKIDAQNR